MNGIVMKLKISLISELMNVIVPICAPTRFVIVTPDRLYQPRPAAIAVEMFMG